MNKTQKSPLSTTLKILGIIFDVILVFIIVISLYTSIAKSVTGKPYATVFGITSAVVHTGSMEGDKEDSIEGNSLIFTVERKEYELGDVVTYYAGGSTVTHRIIEVKEYTFVMKGDANSGIEEIAKETVIGEVFLSIPKVGYAIRYIQANPLILMAIVFVCAAVIFLPIIFKKEDA